MILANPQHPGEKAELRVSLEAAEHLRVQTSYVQILPGENPENAFDRIRKERVQGIVVFQDAGMVARAAKIVKFAHAGFLATYGPNLDDAYRRLAVYADRLLKGARPGSLPVELPTRIELAVNMKTAKALGLTIPQSVLLRADEVIQ